MLTGEQQEERSHPSPEPVPEKFGRYVLLDCLGEGGMAEVFRALVPGAEGFRREVVVKRILASQAQVPQFVEMFVQEARISALLHHPNIVQVFDFGQVDGSYFLAMELLDGWEVGAINRALRETQAKMPIEVAVYIAHEVLVGLAYAHTLNAHGRRSHIVHRDVSPSNIMCLRAGGVKLLDFGVASASGGSDADAAVDAPFCGKISYAAPEYVLGRGQDARIDLFSVGVVLWEMLVGERLFRCKSDDETRAALLCAPVLPPSAKRPAVPAEIDQIVMKALERDPARRYQSAAEMAEGLDRFLDERRFSRQALPRMLSHLFGEEPAVAAEVTGVEELLQSRSTVRPATIYAQSQPVRRSWSPANLVRYLDRSRIALVVFMGAAAVLSFALLRAANRSGGTGVVALSPVRRATPEAPEIHPISPRAPATLATRSDFIVARRSTPSHATSASSNRRWALPRPAIRREPVRAKSHAARPDPGAISGGRAMDPFAESPSPKSVRK